MVKVFEVCFLVGVILAVVSFVLGHILDIAGFDGIDFDGDVDFDMLDTGIIPLSPTVYLILITVFGGIGKILTIEKSNMNIVHISLIAFVSGLVVAFIINKFVILPLKKHQYTSARSRQDCIGMTAIVNETIMENGFGEIRYVVESNSYTTPAKSVDGKAVERGSEVIIRRIEDDVFYVESKDKE